MLKTYLSVQTWCNDDRSNTENSADHFCEDTRQNALATTIDAVKTQNQKLSIFGRQKLYLYLTWLRSTVTHRHQG